jgi:hypothetical protein
MSEAKPFDPKVQDGENLISFFTDTEVCQQIVKAFKAIHEKKVAGFSPQ